MTRAETKKVELEKQGWAYDHMALYGVYHAAGTVTTMVSRGGKEFCRIHDGKSVGKHSWQVTFVMCRPHD